MMRLPRKGMTITEVVFETVLTSEEIAQRVDDLAERMAPDLRDGTWTAVVILLGATPFASDLIRALGRRGAADRRRRGAGAWSAQPQPPAGV